MQKPVIIPLRSYNTNNELPIHLAKELDVISAMIDKAATELALRRCKRLYRFPEVRQQAKSTIRISYGRYNTIDEAKTVADAIRMAYGKTM